MKLTRNLYTNLKGNQKRESHYHAEFDDPLGIPRRLPLLISLKRSRRIVNGLTALLKNPGAGEPLSGVVRDALRLLPLSSLRMVIGWGLVSERTALPGQRLVDYSEEYRRHLMRTRLTDEKSAMANKIHLDSLFAVHDWYSWPDIDTDALKTQYHCRAICTAGGDPRQTPLADGMYTMSLFLAFNDWMVEHQGVPDLYGASLRKLLW